jgi:hypothetical protein
MTASVRHYSSAVCVSNFRRLTKQLRKATISAVMIIRLSVSPYGTTRLQPDAFSWNYVCTKICRHIPVMVKKETNITDTSHEGLRNLLSLAMIGLYNRDKCSVRYNMRSKNIKQDKRTMRKSVSDLLASWASSLNIVTSLYLGATTQRTRQNCYVMPDISAELVNAVHSYATVGHNTRR